MRDGLTTMDSRFLAGGAEQSFALSSVHLKSEANDWKPRMEQLDFLDSKVAPDHDTSVIVGDFNFLFKREEVRSLNKKDLNVLTL